MEDFKNEELEQLWLLLTETATAVTISGYEGNRTEVVDVLDGHVSKYLGCIFFKETEETGRIVPLERVVDILTFKKKADDKKVAKAVKDQK